MTPGSKGPGPPEWGNTPESEVIADPVSPQSEGTTAAIPLGVRFVVWIAECLHRAAESAARIFATPAPCEATARCAHRELPSRGRGEVP